MATAEQPTLSFKTTTQRVVLWVMSQRLPHSLFMVSVVCKILWKDQTFSIFLLTQTPVRLLWLPTVQSTPQKTNKNRDLGISWSLCLSNWLPCHCHLMEGYHMATHTYIHSECVIGPKTTNSESHMILSELTGSTSLSHWSHHSSHSLWCICGAAVLLALYSLRHHAGQVPGHVAPMLPVLWLAVPANSQTFGNDIDWHALYAHSSWGGEWESQ